MKKKALVIVLIFGCLLIMIGCSLRLVSHFKNNNVETRKTEMLSVKEAISGEVGYYLENDNLVISYGAKNKADNDVKITKATFIIREFVTNKEVYRKTIDVDKQVKAGKKEVITFENVEFSADELINYDLKVEVE